MNLNFKFKTVFSPLKYIFFIDLFLIYKYILFLVDFFSLQGDYRHRSLDAVAQKHCRGHPVQRQHFRLRRNRHYFCPDQVGRKPGARKRVWGKRASDQMSNQRLASLGALQNNGHRGISATLQGASEDFEKIREERHFQMPLLQGRKSHAPRVQFEPHVQKNWGDPFLRES